MIKSETQNKSEKISVFFKNSLHNSNVLHKDAVDMQFSEKNLTKFRSIWKMIPLKFVNLDRSARENDKIKHDIG